MLTAAVGAVLVLLVGGGAFAAATLDGGLGFLGGAGQQANAPDNAPKDVAEEGPPPPQTPSESTPSSTPTEPTAPSAGGEPTTVDLLQGFVSGYYDALSREDWAAAYSMLDEESKRRIAEEEWTRAQANLAASGDLPPIASATVEGPYVSETQAPFSTNVSLTYEDGTSETREVTLVSEYVVDEVGDYHRHLTDEEVSYLEGFVGEGSAEPTAPEATTAGLGPGGEDQVREAAEQYYYAVDYEQWDYTYNNLDSRSRALFDEEEWAQKNQWYADNEGLVLDSMEVDVEVDPDGQEADVTVARIFVDGTSVTRETHFVWEGGWWKHRLTEEEKAIFMPGVPYEEFVAAQQGGTPGGTTTGTETVGGDPCGSIPAGDYTMEECRTGRTYLDGISDRPLTFVELLVSGADPGTGGGTGLSTDLAHDLQEEYGYDIVHVEVEFGDDFGGAGAAYEDDTAFSSLEVQEAYFDWEQ